MISPRLQVRAINPEHWARLVDLMLPPSEEEGDRAPGVRDKGLLGSLLAKTTAPDPSRSSTATSLAMPAVVLHRRGKLLRVVQLGGGTLPVSGLSAVEQQELRRFRLAHRLPLVVALDLERLPELWAELQQGVRLADDLAVQHYEMLVALKKRMESGEVMVEPRLFGAVPLPATKMLQLTFNRLLPDRRSVVFYLVDRGRIWTSLIAAKRDGDIYLITTHDAVADRVHFGSIARDARQVVREVSKQIEPVHLGIFLPLAVWHETVNGDRSAVARAMAARRAVVDPAPAWLLTLVGAGVVAEAATRSGRLASQLLATRLVRSPLLAGRTRQAAEKMVQTLSNPLEALGLDPWEALRWGRDWRRRIQLDRSVFVGKDKDS